MKKGQVIQVRVEKLAYGGQGIARINQQVIFVEGGLPGDVAQVKVEKVKKNFLQTRVIELLEPSSMRIKAACQHFGYCGGCKWQNLDYSQQIIFKREQIIENLGHLAGAEAEIVHPTLPSPLIFEYRNKMEFSFTNRRWLEPEKLSQPQIKKGYGLGLHIAASFDQVMAIEKCWLQDGIMNSILTFSQNFFNNPDFPVFNLKAKTGLLRFLVIRKSFSRKEYMVNVVTFRPAAEDLKDYARQLTEKFSEVCSVVNVVNRRLAQIAFGDEEHLLWGKPFITETLDDFDFDISANSFFQTNTLQSKNLYRTVQKFAGSGHRLIWDLYSGTGTIALFLSRQAKRVVGFELVESAVKDAQKNCLRNNVDNCEFIGGEIRHTLCQMKEVPEVVVCDPPRGGMHPDIVREILRIKPQKIIYVSCNPATMARDIKELISTYRLQEVQPIDMFPHTHHIEAVAKLEQR